MLLHVVYTLIFAVFVKLSSAQDVPCSITIQDDGLTRYSVPDFTATKCYYSWANASDHVLANQEERVDELVKMKTDRTLVTSRCLPVVHYKRDCISEKVQRTSTCNVNCTGEAESQGGEGTDKPKLVFVKLSSAQDVPCSITIQDDGLTRYSVPDFTATKCYYSWANASGHVLANQEERVDELVKMKTDRTLVTFRCLPVVHYKRDCISEKVQRTSTCNVNCTGEAESQGGEVFVKLSSAQDVPCSITLQDDGLTRYSVPDFTATECYYSWANASGHVLANQEERVDELVKMKTDRTLVTSRCLPVVHYKRDCISEKVQHTSTCNEISQSHWIAPVVIAVMLLLVLLGCLCYWIHTSKKKPYSPPSMDDGESGESW